MLDLIPDQWIQVFFKTISKDINLFFLFQKRKINKQQNTTRKFHLHAISKFCGPWCAVWTTRQRNMEKVERKKYKRKHTTEKKIPKYH